MNETYSEWGFGGIVDVELRWLPQSPSGLIGMRTLQMRKLMRSVHSNGWYQDKLECTAWSDVQEIP